MKTAFEEKNDSGESLHSLEVAQRCSLLVVSCDAYNDLWPPFFNLFNRFWSDCPFPIYLGAKTKTWSDPRVANLTTSAPDRDWSSCLMQYLNQIPTSYVILMLDDFFLRATVENQKLLQCLAFAEHHHATQIRLIPRPAATAKRKKGALVGESEMGSPYRLSMQASIWNRMELLKLLREGESIWDFEHNGNRRIETVAEGFFSVWTKVLPYQGLFAHHVVEKGKWLLPEKWIFDWRNIGCDFSRRGTLPIFNLILYYSAQLTSASLFFLSWPTQVKIKQTLKKMLRPFLGRQLLKMHSGTAEKFDAKL